MKDYISICYATRKGEDAAFGSLLGFEFQAKNFKTAENVAREMFSKTSYDTATWCGTSRLKYNKTRDDFELADKKLNDMLIGVDEWIVVAGADLKDVNLTGGTVKVPEAVVPSLPAPTTATSTAKTWGKHPITEEVIRSARYYSHYEYKSEERKEVFK